jgi:hypothetical protein
VEQIKITTMFEYSLSLSKPSSLTLVGAGLAVLYLFRRRKRRRSGRDMKAIYAAKFEERAWVARSLNESLAQAIFHSQSVVHAMRTHSKDDVAMKSGFTLIERWLDVAAAHVDTAVRSLETPESRAELWGDEGRNNGYARKDHNHDC